MSDNNFENENPDFHAKENCSVNWESTYIDCDNGDLKEKKSNSQSNNSNQHNYNTANSGKGVNMPKNKSRRGGGCRRFGAFVLGMFVGVFTFVGVCAGTVYALFKNFNIKMIEDKVGFEIPVEGSYKTDDIATLIQHAIKVAQNVNSKPIGELVKMMGVELGDTININGAEIDLSGIMNSKISDLGNIVPNMLNTYSLNDICALIGYDLKSLEFPIIQDNKDMPIMDFVNKVTKIATSDLSLYSIEKIAGLKLDLGEGDSGITKVLEKYKYMNINNLSKAIDTIKLSDIIEVDTDKYLKIGEELVVFAKPENKFVKIENANELNSQNFKNITDGNNIWQSYYKFVGDEMVQRPIYYEKVAKLDESGNPTTEFEYVKYFEKDSNGVILFETDKELYKKVEYATLSSLSDNEKTGLQNFYVQYKNSKFVKDGTNWILENKGFFDITEVFKNDGVTKLSIADFANGKIVPQSNWKYAENNAMETYKAPTPWNAEKNSLVKTDIANATYIKAHNGTSESALKTLSDCSVQELGNAGEMLKDMTLGDFVEVNDESHAILKQLKDIKIAELANSVEDTINNLALTEVLDIVETGENKSPQILIALSKWCAGVDGYTENEPVKIGDLSKRLDYMKLGDAIQYEGDMAIFDALKDSTLKQLPDKLDTLTLGEVFKINKDGDDKSPDILIALSEWCAGVDGHAQGEAVKLSELEDRIDSLVVDDVFDIVESGDNKSPKMLIAIAKWGAGIDGHTEGEQVKITQLQDRIETLIIGDTVEISDESYVVLKKLAPIKITELGSQVQPIINELKIGEIIDVVESGDNASPKILIALKDTQIQNLSNEINNLSLGDMMDCETNGFYQQLKDSTMDTLQTDISNTVQNSLISDLMDWGILPENATIRASFGAMTLTQFFAAVANPVPIP